MNSAVSNRTADSYVNFKYSVSRVNADRATRPSYISEDWDGQRIFERLAAGYHADNVAEATAHVQKRHLVDLQRLAKENVLRGAKDILNSLAVNYAFTWVDISRLIGVSVPAIRKWRMEGGVSPENIIKLAHLEAFAFILKDRGVNASAWMSTPLLAGYTVAPKHLYTLELAPELLDLALDGYTAQQFLDSTAFGWRERFDSGGFSVAVFDDGVLGITTE